MSELRNTSTSPIIAALTGLALTTTPAATPITNFSMPIQSGSIVENSQTIIQTFPYDFRISSRGQALSLFTKQEYYTLDELNTYKSMLKKKSRKLGLSINDLLKKKMP